MKLAKLMGALLVLALLPVAVPAAAQPRHPDNTIPSEKIEPSPAPSQPGMQPGSQRGTVRPPATGDAQISKPPPADTHFPTPVLPPPAR